MSRTPSLADKSDVWLVDALRSADEADRNAATAHIMEAHTPQLRAFMRKKLSAAWAEDALNDTWLAFYAAVRRSGVETSIGQLLGGIATHKRADKVAYVAQEKRVEADLPYDLDDPWDSIGAANDVDVVGEVEADEARDYLLGLPYGQSVLTPCERMLWALEKQYEYPRETIARILGKGRDTLNTHLSNAHLKVRRFLHRGDYAPETWDDNPFPNRNPHFSDQVVIIESFESWFLPRLNEEELEPLGMSAEELEENYTSLLLVPRWKASERDATEYGGLDLLLIRKDDTAQWRKEAGRLMRNPAAKRFRFPATCLIHLDVDNGLLKLEPQTLIEIWPDLDPEEQSDNVFLSVHNVPGVVPVMFSPLDEGLYDDPDIFNGGTAWDCWPFLALTA